MTLDGLASGIVQPREPDETLATRPAILSGSKAVPSAAAVSAVRPGTILAASFHEGLLVSSGNSEVVALLNVQIEE